MSPLAQHACKWPTCQSEQYQQDLAEQIKQELVGRTDQEIVDQTEELAVWLLDWCFGHKPETKTPMRESIHPFAQRCWAAACHIQEMLTATDPENAVAELEGAPDDNTSPHPTQRQPLTDEETKLLWHKARFCMGSNRWTVFKNLIEAAHNIKEST